MTITSENDGSIYYDYLNSFPRLDDFFHYPPRLIEVLKQRIDDLQADYSFNRQALVSALRQRNGSLGAPSRTMDFIQELEQEETMVLVSGQQAGVMTGPLYTVYKALATIKLVERLRTEEGLQVVPLFWVASEDHDLQEVARIKFMTRENRLEELGLFSLPQPSPAVGHLPLGGALVLNELEEMLDAFEAGVIATEFTPEIMELLRETLASSSDLVEWFSRLMLALFGDRGLIIFDPLQAELQQLLKPFWQRTLADYQEINDAFQQQSRNLKERGYTLQLEKERDQLPFFISLPERRALFVTKGGFQTRGGEFHFSRQELEDLLEKAPWLFTSSAHTRPLLQSYLLPVLASFGGPGEVAYHAQLGGIFDTQGVKMPPLLPRPGLTLVEERISSYLDKYCFEVSDVLAGRLQDLLQERLEELSGVDIGSCFEELNQQWSRQYLELIEELGTIDQQLIPLGKKNLERIREELSYLEEKAHQFNRRNHDLIRRQFKKVELSLYPGGRLQERSYNVFQYLNKYGFQFLDYLSRQLPSAGEHHFLRCGGDCFD